LLQIRNEFIGNEVYDGKVSNTTEVINSNLALDESLSGLVWIDAKNGQEIAFNNSHNHFFVVSLYCNSC
jgi:hypothetical protein